MPNKRQLILGGFAILLAGCSQKFQTYRGPQVTRIVIQKGNRRLFLLNNQTVLRGYDIDLGFAPRGQKQIEGDGKTPEGSYYIDRKNPESAYFLSLGISYPNKQDRARAAAQNQDPGGDIFIHGASGTLGQRGTDWTFGCISVSDKEISEIYSMVNKGTQIDLLP